MDDDVHRKAHGVRSQPLPPGAARTALPGGRRRLRPGGGRKRRRRRLFRLARRFERPGEGDELHPRGTAPVDGLPPSPRRQGLHHAEYARLFRRIGGPGAGRANGHRRRRRCRAGAGPRRRPAPGRTLPRLAAARLDANVACQRRSNPRGRGPGDIAGRARPGAVPGRNPADSPANAAGHRGLRPRRVVHCLLRAVHGEFRPRRAQRQPRPVCPAVPTALRVDPRRPPRGPRPATLPPQPPRPRRLRPAAGAFGGGRGRVEDRGAAEVGRVCRRRDAALSHGARRGDCRPARKL